MDKLTGWLAKEVDAMEKAESPSAYNAGYTDALINILDFLQGAEVYIQSLDEKTIDNN